MSTAVNGYGGERDEVISALPAQPRLAPAELAVLTGTVGLGRTGYEMGVDCVAYHSPRDALGRFVSDPPILLLICFPSDEPGTLPTVLRAAGIVVRDLPLF